MVDLQTETIVVIVISSLIVLYLLKIIVQMKMKLEISILNVILHYHLSQFTIQKALRII